MKIKYLSIFIFLCFISSYILATNANKYIYSIKLNDYDNISDAEVEKDYLINKEWYPVIIKVTESSNNLIFGEFEYYVDALIYKNEIEKSYGFNCEIISERNSEDKTLVETQGPYERIFKMEESHMSEVPDLSLNEEDPLVIEIKDLMNSADKALYRQKLTDSITTLNDDDIRKGFVLTRKGIFELLENNYEEAIEQLRKVSNGEVKATRVDRIKCIRRVAWIMHQQKDRLGAYKAYREMESFTGSELCKAIAKVECAGLLMELARSEKGTLVDCRRECEKVVEMIPAENIADFDYGLQLAIAELMHLESWFFDHLYQKCINEGEEFLDKYDDRFNRERAACLVFMGICYYKLDDYGNAEDCFSKVLNMDIEREWKDVDSKKKSLSWLIYIAEKRGDTALLNHWKLLKQELYNE